MNYPAESICPKWGLHRFKAIVDNKEALVEVCGKCGKKEIYRKIGGTIDDRKYARANYRMALQPNGKTKKDFEREYPKIFKKPNKRIIQAGNAIYNQ